MTDWKALCAELAEYLALLDEPPHELVCRAQEALAQPEPEVAGPTDDELLELMPNDMRDELSYAAKVCSDATGGQVRPRIFRVCLNTAALEYARAVLARYGHQPAPVPVASHIYFEFVISDADYCTQAGGIAPTYAQALSEGQHYLAQYLQDGPHTLELRRVEVLNPDALPLPAGEVQP